MKIGIHGGTLEEAYEAARPLLIMAETEAEPAVPDEHPDLLPIQVGDRFVDESGDWEVVTHPSVAHGGKALHARA